MPRKVPTLATGLVLGALAIGWGLSSLARSPADGATATEPADVVTRNAMVFPDFADLAATPVNGDCTLRATANSAPDASVRIAVDAPCNPGQIVTIHHSGLMFTMAAEDDGRVEVTVPAMRSRAVFIIALPDGAGTVVTRDVAGLDQWSRVALQWDGNAAFQIHAREFGADYGTPGHVWAGTPTNPEAGSTLIRLGDGKGDSPRTVEIYSFPQASGRSGIIELTVETEVTADTCGQSQTAEALERTAAGQLTSRDLDLAMPNCSAIGDFLVLNNFIDDLKIDAD